MGRYSHWRWALVTRFCRIGVGQRGIVVGIGVVVVAVDHESCTLDHIVVVIVDHIVAVIVVVGHRVAGCCSETGLHIDPDCCHWWSGIGRKSIGCWNSMNHYIGTDHQGKILHGIRVG